MTATTSTPPGVTADDLPPHLREAHDRLSFGAAEILPAGGLAERLLAAEREGRPLRVKLGIVGTDTGANLLDPAAPIRLLAGTPVPAAAIRQGPRVGVAAAAEVPWRFWVDADPTVSPYRSNTRRRPIPT